MADNQQNPQVVFLPEGTKRTRGRDAQHINILVGKAVASAVKSTLGPKGMDKMIVDDLGDITISNDGATILQEMSIEHPVGKMMVEIAKTQDSEVGDGTTSAVVIAGGLLSEAEKLIDDEIHPSIIIRGYRLASRKALEVLDDMAESIDIKDKKMLHSIASTSMTGKAAEATDELSNLVVEAIGHVLEMDDKKVSVDVDNVKVEKKTGTGLSASELIKGIVVDKEIVHANMPKRIENARIALIDAALEIKETETDAKIEITAPDQLQAFLDQEEGMLRKMVDQIKKSGANVLVCQKGIDDMAQHFLAKEGISAIRRVKKSDMDALIRATGGRLVTRLEDLSASDLGHAKTVYEKKVAGDNMVFIEGCKNPKSVSLLLRGGGEHVLDEAERAVHDALMAVGTAIKSGKVVTGGGAPEIEVSVRLRDFAQTVGGREQLAIEGFANAMEEIPRTLAETAGMDKLDSIVALRAKHRDKKGGTTIGVDVFGSKIGDLRAKNVIEPLSVKRQAIISASEVAEMILRIDDVIAGGNKRPNMPPADAGMGMDM